MNGMTLRVRKKTPKWWVNVYEVNGYYRLFVTERDIVNPYARRRSAICLTIGEAMRKADQYMEAMKRH